MGLLQPGAAGVGMVLNNAVCTFCSVVMPCPCHAWVIGSDVCGLTSTMLMFAGDARRVVGSKIGLMPSKRMV